MAAGEYDIVSEQGTSFKLSLTYKDSTNSVISDTQALLSLTGVTGSHSGVGIRGSLTGGGSSAEFTTGTTQGQTGTGGIMLNTSSTGGTGTTGGIYIQIDASTLSNVPAGNHVYDLEIVSGSSVDRLLQGRFEVTAEVTR